MDTIFHPTDFSRASHRAFAHALRLAVIAKSTLTVYHTEPHNPAASWDQFPHVRQLLADWGMIPEQSPREAIYDLGIGIEKVSAAHRSARDSVLKYLEKYPHQLIVLATHQHSGLRQLFRRSVAEQIARRSGDMALFIPAKCEGFVSLNDGTVSLRNILILSDTTYFSQLGIEAAQMMVRSLGVTEANFFILQKNGKGESRQVEEGSNECGKWFTISDDRSPLIAVTQVAEEVSAELIIVSSAGRDTIAERLFGSLAERVVRQAPCPVLTVPIGSIL